MLEARKTYKHERNTDVAMEVQKVLGIDEAGTWSVVVSWWNVKAKVPRKIVRYQVVGIKRVEVSNWKEIDMWSGGRVA